MNQLNVSLQHSIVTLAGHGWSHRRIARELGINRETVGKYLRLARSKPAISTLGSAPDLPPKPAISTAGLLQEPFQRRPLVQGVADGLAQRALRARLRRRAAIEPLISHLKHQYRLARCFLKGFVGDQMNLLLAAAAWNLRQGLRAAALVWLQSIRLLAADQRTLTVSTDSRNGFSGPTSSVV